MHDAARLYVAQWATPDPIRVIELGSLDINGNVRGMFPNAEYVGVDLVDGRGVDVVADAAVWQPVEKADMVICCEVFEHTRYWRRIITNIAANMLRPDGRVILTMAGPGRAPHSAKDGGHIRHGEFYRNVDPDDLEAVCIAAGLLDVKVDQFGEDVRATGVI